MSDITEHDDLEQEEQDDRTPAALRAAAKRGQDAQNENARLKREVLFLKAGIDPEGNKAAQLLFKTWEGDNLDELRAEAKELGIKLPGSEPEQDPQLKEQQDMRKTLSGGDPAGAGATMSTDPIVEAYSVFHERLKNGTPREDAALEAIDSVFFAASKGDARVIFDPEAWYGRAVSASPRS